MLPRETEPGRERGEIQAIAIAFREREPPGSPMSAHSRTTQL